MPHTITCPYCKEVFHNCDGLECKRIDEEFNICGKTDCTFKFQITCLQNQVEELHAELAQKNQSLEMLGLIDVFRILMLTPKAMDQAIESGKLDPTLSAMEIVRERREGWEKASPATAYTFMMILETFFKEFSRIVGEHRKKVSIKDFEIKNHVKKLKPGSQEEVKPKTAKAPKPKAPTVSKAGLSKFERTVLDTIKIYNCTREEAIEATKLLGIHEES